MKKLIIFKITARYIDRWFTEKRQEEKERIKNTVIFEEKEQREEKS